MTDPYQVLGVPRSASDDEIKKAYRSLSRRYHPDANVNNPNKDQAEEKFKQIQQAYDQIMKEKQQGTSEYGGTYGSSYGGFGSGAAHREESGKLQAAANYIQNRYYKEALNVLNDIPFAERQGRWYYYAAVANQGVGNTATALEHIRRAVELEPSNISYRQFQEHLEYGGTWYTTRGNVYERPYSGSDWCFKMILLNMFCNCCCRPC